MRLEDFIISRVATNLTDSEDITSFYDFIAARSYIWLSTLRNDKYVK